MLEITRRPCRCAADIRLAWPMCRLPMVGTNAMLSRASRQRVTVSRSSAIRVIVCIAGPASRVSAASETVLGRRIGPALDRFAERPQRRERAVAPLLEVLHEARLAPRRDVEHGVQHQDLAI